MQIYTAVFSKSHALVHAMLSQQEQLGMAAQTASDLIAVCWDSSKLPEEKKKKQQARFL